MLWGVPSFIIGAAALFLFVASMKDYSNAVDRKSIDAMPMLTIGALFLIAAAIAFK